MTELFSFYYEAEMLDLLYSNWFFLQKENQFIDILWDQVTEKFFWKKKN